MPQQQGFALSSQLEGHLDNAGIAKLIHEGATVLFQQQKYSNGYTIVGDSEIAEANIVVHTAAPFITNGHAVWAESPFKDRLASRTKHLDMYIDLEPAATENPNILLVEAKRITPGEKDEKLKEIINDCKRLRNWPSHMSSSLFWRPGLEVESVRGALIVLLATEAPRLSAKTLFTSFSYWWKDKDFKNTPAGYSKELLQQLEAFLRTAAIRDVAYSRYADGGVRLAALYAIFDLDSGSVHG